MKLKKWLREYKEMTYAEYRALPDIERWSIEGEFKHFNRVKQIHDSQNWRPMTEEEIEHYNAVSEKEMERYRINLKIGGIDERGNYTALHHRWEEKYRK